MLHTSPSKKHQPSFEMYPYDSNFLPGFEVSGAGTIHSTQSICHDSCVPLSPLASTAECFIPMVSQQSYSLVDYDGHLSQVTQTPSTKSARSFPHSVGNASMRTPVSLSGHPYHLAKLRHRAPAQSQEWSHLPIPTTPAPTPTSGMISPFNAVIDNSASTFCHDPNQLSLLAPKFAPPPTSGLASQSNFVPPNTNRDMPSFMGNLMVSAQTFVSNTPTSPLTPVDQTDIEYAQDRYGNKRCFYQCRFDLSGSPCNKWIVGERTRVLRHLRNHHHLQTGPATPARCRWEQCTHSRPMKQENLSRHVVMHLGVKWKCPHCRRLFSRDDAVHRHIERTVPGMDVTEAEVVPGREARALNESQCRTARIA